MFTCLQENVEDILLHNINNWSHSVWASSLIFPVSHSHCDPESCNELKSDQNCLFVVDVLFSDVPPLSSPDHSVSRHSDSWNRIKVSPVRHHFSALRICEFNCRNSSSGPSYYLVYLAWLWSKLH